MNSALRVAVDIGGTFTDAVIFDPESGTVREAKSSTTPHEFSEGVFDALDVSGIDLTAIEQLIHGTTVVINAITQRSGVKTALITTPGFRDALHIGRGNRPDMYNLRFHKPEPLVPRRLRFEASERMLVDGTEQIPLDCDRLREIARLCAEDGVEAIAICFLHAYAWPAHERAARAFLSELLPEISITCSSDICREWREYERTSTAVLNAYVQPILERYLANLDATLDRQSVSDRRFVMLSNGGSATFDFAREQPIQLVESGPAGGIAGAIAIGDEIGETHLITLDVGGTTAKCSVIVDGDAAISQDYRLEWTPWSPGYPLRIPVVDIVEIGAGGGSIVWFDEGGALRIGPKSAGADPGPACYGRGGAEPTITDAMVLAGVLDPAAFLGGRLTIDPELSARAFQPIADRLELSMTETVSGVLRLFGELTVEALKLVSVRRGYDPRDFTLIAYGGGGPIHAGLLANELGVKRLVIPCFPGSFSAWGMLTTRPRLDSSRTLVSSLAETPHEKRDEVFTSMRQEAESTLASHGFQAGAIEHQCAIDCRYHGQEHTVRVPVDAESASEESFANRFHQLHAQHYTFRLDQTPIELVNFRLTSTVPVDRVRQGTARPPHATEPAPSSRTVAFAHGGPQSTAIYQRTELGAGFSARGPAIIEESSSTSVVQSDQHFTIDRFGNIVIDRIQSSGKERPEIGHA